MDNKEFRELLKQSKLGKTAASKVLGVGRQTIYNWYNGKEIPDSKADFIRNMLSKSPKELKQISKNEHGYSVEGVIPFVVSHFDEFMSYEDFQRKVYIRAFDMAKKIIEENSN